MDSSHLQRTLDRFRTRVPKEKRVQRRVRHNREQLLDEFEVRLVVRDAALEDARGTLALWSCMGRRVTVPGHGRDSSTGWPRPG